MATLAKNGKSRNAEHTRASILRAAIAEFSQGGVAGARTDQIARSAGVNKALLYYYFQDKQALYGAVLEYAFGRVYPKLMGILESAKPPHEKVLEYAAAHFDSLAENPPLCRVIYNEMTRGGATGQAHIEVMARYRKKLAERLQQVLLEGIRAGEFRPVDPMNFAISMAAANVFYFVSAPMFRAISGLDPFTPARIAARRAAVLDFIEHALLARQSKSRTAKTRVRRRKEYVS